MNIKHRLTVRFVIQLAVSGILVLAAAGLSVQWMLQRFEEIQLSHDFASVGLEKLVESSKLGPDGFVFDPKLLDQVKANQGWLQSLDEEGRVVLSYNTPPDVPKHYDPGELLAYWNRTEPFPYELYLYIQEKDGKLFTLVYGVKNELELLLEQVKGGASRDQSGQLLLPDQAAARLQSLGGYVQWLDASGNEMAAYNKPEQIPRSYTIQDLALRTIYKERYGYGIATSYNKDSKDTWIIALPNQARSNANSSSLLPPETRVMIVGVSAMLAAMLLVFIIMSLWSAHRFGAPMLHMLAWLKALSNKVYEEPADRKGRPRSRNSSGQWRRRYRMYTDVMQSLDQLAKTLHRDETLRLQTQELRETWISGITHDLKTPLSAIKGYAHLLANDGYDWSKEEVCSFSNIMLEKSTHMDTLINDLAMTYRLQSGLFPPETEEVELCSWLTHTLGQAASDPAFGEARISYHPLAEEAVVRTYTPWLSRIVTNLVANAFLHNPADTLLTVSLEWRTDHRHICIIFSDNGSGMDERTLDGLFERYYRGTNTVHASAGSGLGMAISKGLVEALGGHVTAESKLGEGTVIRVVFPAAKRTGGD